MFSLARPNRTTIQKFKARQASLELTYTGVGSTNGTPPDGYVVDHTRGLLGAGEAAFTAAQSALRNWMHFRLGWVEPCWPDTPIEPNAMVAILAHTFGLWSLNACRIIYVVEEQLPLRRFGFAYGTLPSHVETGEERFTVEWDHSDDSVWYDILAFSQPNHCLTRLAYPLTRKFQRRFAKDSVAAMQQAVARGNETRAGV